MEIKREFEHDGYICKVRFPDYEWGKPVRIVGASKTRRRYYYFDEEGIYRCAREKQPGILPFVRYVIKYEDVKRGFGTCTDYLNDWHSSYFYRGLVRLKAGQTLDDWLHLSMDIYLHPDKYGSYKNGEKKGGELTWKQRAKENPMIRYVTMNGRIKFARVPENESKDTFDYIMASAYISAVEDKYKFVKEHKKEILSMMLERISNMKSFKRYGVPIGILKAGRCVLGNDGYLYVTFEIKDELRKLFEADKASGE